MYILYILDRLDELENNALDVNEILECKIAQDSVVKCPEPVRKSQYVSFEFPIRKENTSFSVSEWNCHVTSWSEDIENFLSTMNSRIDVFVKRFYLWTAVSRLTFFQVTK